MVLHVFPREVLEIFNESQKSKISHGRLSKALLKRYNKMGFDSFWPKFLTVLKMVCRESDRTPPMERLVQFIVKFVLEANACDLKRRSLTPDDDGFGKLMAGMFKFSLQWNGACGPGVRLRCVQFTAKLLEGMGDDAVISETMFIDIQTMLLQRIWDVKPFIRAEATHALSRLQDPTDRDCPVVTAFLYLLRHDASPDVRRAAIQSIAISTRTLPEVLSRSRDVADSVRRAVFEIIVDKVSLRPLTIAKRIKVLKDGMSDRSLIVREMVSNKLLPSWLSTRDNSPVMLLKALDVEGSPEECEKACVMLFDNMRKADTLKEHVDAFVREYLDGESRVPKMEKLCSETAFFWRVLVEYLKRSVGCPEDDALLESCLPLGNALCAFMRALLKRYEEVPINELEVRLVNEFIASHVISLAKSVDFSDEFGRKALKDFVRDCLISPNSSVCYGLVSVLLDLLVKIDPRVIDPKVSSEVVEMISELREPMVQVIEQVNSTTLEETLPPPRNPPDEQTGKIDRKLEMRLATIKVALNVAKEELDNCVTRMDFESAGPIRDRLKSLEEEKSRLMSKIISVEVKEEDVKSKEEEDNDSDEDKEEGRGLLADVDTLIKANTMAVELLKRVHNSTSLTPSLRTLVTSLILPSITNADPGVRNLAVTGLGLICIFDRGLARKYLPLFGQISRVDHVAIRVSALKSLFDCFLAFGLDTFKDITFEDPTREEVKDNDGDVTLANLFQESRMSTMDEDVKSVAESDIEEKDDETATTTNGQQTSLLSFIIDLLDSEAAELRTVCVEGLVRLVYLGLVTSSKLLSRLLLLWFNPLTEDDTTLRHCLAVFLPAFCFTKADYQATMTEAVIPTLKTLFLAPQTSPLAKVDVWNVASLMIHLTDAANLFSNKCDKTKSTPQTVGCEEGEEDEADKENTLVPGQAMKPASRPVPKLRAESVVKLENPCHDELALSLSNALLNNVEPESIRIYVRMLTKLRISTVNLPLRKELYVMLHKIFQKKVLDKMQVRSLQKFQERLKMVLTAAEVDLDALLTMEETSETSAALDTGKDKRMAALLAEEKRRRKMRRSSFTRGLCGSDEEPTLLETTAPVVEGTANQNAGRKVLNKTTCNATMLERTYIGAKFKDRGNLTIGYMTKRTDAASTILVNDSEEEEEEEAEVEEADATIVKSETDEEMTVSQASQQTQETDEDITLTNPQNDTAVESSVMVEEMQNQESSTVSPSCPSTVASSASNDDETHVSEARVTRRSSRSNNSKLRQSEGRTSRSSIDQSSQASEAPKSEVSVANSETSSLDSAPAVSRRKSKRQSKLSAPETSTISEVSQHSSAGTDRRRSGKPLRASSDDSNTAASIRTTRRSSRNVQFQEPDQPRRQSNRRSSMNSRAETSLPRMTRRTSAGQIEGKRQRIMVTRNSLDGRMLSRR